jgi:hypothetical protein
MQVDRAEFLRLATLLFGIAGCGDRTPAPAGPPAPTPAPSEQQSPVKAQSGGAPLANRVEPPTSARPPADPAADPSCSNQRGTLRACARVSPTCEGLRGECKTLDEDLVPRVAEKWAECFANAKTACRPKSLGACMQAAVEHACVEPGAVATCRSLMKACDDAGSAPSYTLEQCAKVVSAVKPDGPGRWHEVDLERMGPGSTQEACSLEYVLPYQPYGWMWR